MPSRMRSTRPTGGAWRGCWTNASESRESIVVLFRPSLLALNHVGQVRRSGWIGEKRRLEVAAPNPGANRESEKVDLLLRMWANQMRAEYPFSAGFDQHFESGVLRAKPAGRVPLRRVLVVYAKFQSLFFCRCFKQPHKRYRWKCVSDASYRGQLWRAVISLEQICRYDFTFHPGHGSQGRSFSRRVSSRVHGRV